jgi:hypothetical protein
MKKVLVTGCCIILLSTFCFGQESQKSETNNVKGTYTVWFMDGMWFEPAIKDDSETGTKLCDGYSSTFYLNNIRLSLAQLLALNLKAKHLSNHRSNVLRPQAVHKGCGTYEYKYLDTASCVGNIVFTVNTKLPIYVNGVRYADETDIKHLNIENPDDIKSIKRKWRLFSGYVLRIETN